MQKFIILEAALTFPISSRRIFLGNLSRSVRERDIERFFEEYRSIKYGHMIFNYFETRSLSRQTHYRHIDIRNGFGFVEFDDDREADDAVREKDGRRMGEGGKKVRVAWAREGRTRLGPRTNYRIIVDNLSSRTSWQDLKEFFSQGIKNNFVEYLNLIMLIL